MYSYNQEFLLEDGRPILPVMGEFHFSRYPKEEWEQALRNIRLGGVDIVATYVFWIHHEEARGEWNFEGERCLREFLACCERVGLKVWLRIGPWAHGECRNGGFPDWLVDMEKRGEIKLRVNDPTYLELVDRLYSKIGEQAAGYMYKDGGPVIGIQLENEYGHCGGPSDRAEGMAHMNELKKIAQMKGLDVPYYSATGWGGAYVPEGFLAVLGGYVDAPWAEHTHELEASENFLFKPFHDDANIGSDFASEGSSFTFDISKVPYLTAELGGGLEVTTHRRTYPYPEDIEAQTVCMLGAGANLIGYYMYHGGVNPDGRYSTLQESKATGYNNDLPVKSYDFQTCLRENGLPSESFYRLRKHHIFIKAVQELLAPARVYMPSNIPAPSGAEDMETLRACFRYNEEKDCGFLFINNHQRKRSMTEKWITKDKPLCFKVPAGNIVFENIHVKPDAVMILPYKLPVNTDGSELRLCHTNASYLACADGIYYFYTDEDKENVYFEWSDGEEHQDIVRVLTAHEAELAFSDLSDISLEKAGNVCFNVEEMSDVRKEYREYTLELEYDGAVLGKVNSGKGGKNVKNVENIKDSALSGFSYKDVYLELDFGGDRAELYENGRLLDDWFSNGENWRVALGRYGFPRNLTLRLYPYSPEVYYDLEPKIENVLCSAELRACK